MTILKSFNPMNPNSDDYDEVVNLSRMMLSETDTTNYNVYDNCRQALMYRENNSKLPQEVDIYPNPTEGNFTVDLPAIWDNGTMEIYSIDGILVEKVSIENKNRIELKLKLNNGTYLMKLRRSTFKGKYS